MHRERNEVSLSSPDDERILLPRLDNNLDVDSRKDHGFQLQLASKCNQKQSIIIIINIISLDHCWCCQLKSRPDRQSVCLIRVVDPVPGGCNLELPLENDPNLYMTTSASQTHVKFAYGNVDISSGVADRCGSQRQHYLPVYDVYQKYMYEEQLGEETFFAAVTQMITVDNITTTARWVSCD